MASSTIHKKLRIGGMTCVNCQKKIQQKLRNTAGVTKAAVSYAEGTAEVTYDTDILCLKDITGVIEALGYQVLPEKAAAGPGLGRAAGILAVIVGLYMLLERFGVLNLLAPSMLADATVSYGLLFVIGLATSVHCIAMCGGVNLSQCLPAARADEGAKGAAATLAPALLYNLGRVISYTAMGFLLGLAGYFLGGGSGAGVPVMLQGIIKLIAGVCMVVMGVNMLGLFPALRRLTIRPPKGLARRVNEGKAKARRPLVVGLLNGLMPCGPLQSMQLVALASGSPWAGALSMLLFSLGTVPLMLGLGALVAALGKRFTRVVNTAGAVLVAVMGLAMLSQGCSLSGLVQPGMLMALVVALAVVGLVACIPIPKRALRAAALAATVLVAAAGIATWQALRPGDEAADGPASLAGGVQEVNSTLSAGRYPSITVEAGTPVRWVIDAPAGSINGCNYRMLLKEYGIEHTFQQGENIIEFTPTEAGTYTYTCWMGMIRGNIFVVDPSSQEAAAVESPGVPVAAGYRIPTEALAVAQPVEDEAGGAYQQVTIALGAEGFQPAVVVVEKELPTLWVIQNTLATPGGGELLVPAYATALDLAQGDNPLTLYPSESFEVSTGDSAFYAYVKVVEDIARLDEEAIRAEAAQFQTIIYPEAVYVPASASGS